MVHVFVVDENTLKYHLEYMFAGTGAKDKKVDFLINFDKSNTHSTTERNLVGMIADVSKIRTNDKILFYVQHTTKFYGVFKAVSKAFFDENDSDNYLANNLKKGLSFRIKIAPDEVYANGITEHELLDMLYQKEHPSQLCWSLIYRKLKGNRGCTMVFDYEYADIIHKIKAANNNVSLNGNSFTYDKNTQLITSITNINTYQGRMNSIDIKNRMLFKANRGNAFEVHLQAYILQNFDTQPLHSIIYSIPENNAIWIGNEVSCGVGMQRIDLMTIQENHSTICIKIIELKCIPAYVGIVHQQLPWYIQWISDYVAPNYNKQVKIIPCILALKNNNNQFVTAVQAFQPNVIGMQPNVSIEPIEYYEFSVDADSISFNKIL